MLESGTRTIQSKASWNPQWACFPWHAIQPSWNNTMTTNQVYFSKASYPKEKSSLEMMPHVCFLKVGVEAVLLSLQVSRPQILPRPSCKMKTGPTRPSIHQCTKDFCSTHFFFELIARNNILGTLSSKCMLRRSISFNHSFQCPPQKNKVGFNIMIKNHVSNLPTQEAFGFSLNCTGWMGYVEVRGV